MFTKTLLVALISISLVSCATAQHGALSLARKAENRGDFLECVRLADGASTYGSHTDATNAQITFQKGTCLEGLGRKAEAFALYRNLIAKYPDSDWAAQAKGRLEANSLLR